MLQFLLGVAVGVVVARASPRKLMIARSSTGSGTIGRVDELSSAADHPPPDTQTLNAGDGTPSGRSVPPVNVSSPATGVSPQGSAATMGQSSDAFNRF